MGMDYQLICEKCKEYCDFGRKGVMYTQEPEITEIAAFFNKHYNCYMRMGRYGLPCISMKITHDGEIQSMDDMERFDKKDEP